MRVWPLAVALCVVSCGGDTPTEPAPIAVQGTWNGPVQVTSSSSGSMALTLTETNGTVSGSGTLAASGGSVAVTANGTYVPPTLSLTISAPGFSDLNLTATVGEQQMTGTLNGSGFLNSAVILNRQ